MCDFCNSSNIKLHNTRSDEESITIMNNLFEEEYDTRSNVIGHIEYVQLLKKVINLGLKL